MIESSNTQREALEGALGSVALLTFWTLRPGADERGFLARSERAVTEAGGRRLTLPIEQVLAGPELACTVATWDGFRDGASALRAWDAGAAARAAAVDAAHALLLRPNRAAPVVTSVLRRLSWVFRWFAHIEEGRPIEPDRVFGDPRLLSTQESFERLMQGDPDRPFFNINLARFVGGEAGRVAVTKRIYDPSGLKLLALGGHAAAVGKVLGTFVGDAQDPLFDAWNDVAIAAWPSRAVFRDYMANVDDAVVEARTELMDRAMQIVCSVPPAG